MMSETKERTPFEREVDKKFIELEERIDLKISKIQNGLDAILLRMDEFMIGMRYTGSPVTPRLPVAETEDEIEEDDLRIQRLRVSRDISTIPKAFKPARNIFFENKEDKEEVDTEA